MNRTLSRPVILRLPSDEPQPRILRFPKRAVTRRGEDSTATQRGSAPAAPNDDSSNADLSAVRERLLRMIVTSEWDRSHGNRAS